jgi:hypothetical protein
MVKSEDAVVLTGTGTELTDDDPGVSLDAAPLDAAPLDATAAGATVKSNCGKEGAPPTSHNSCQLPTVLASNVPAFEKFPLESVDPIGV